MAIKIQINKAVEEFDIAGKIYSMGMGDDDLKRYMSEWDKFQLEIAEIEKLPTNEQSDEKAKELFRKVYDLFLGEGSFNSIYDAIGRSSFVMVDIIKQIMDVVQIKYLAQSNENKQQKYLKKKQR